MEDTLYKNLTNSTQELESMTQLLSNISNEIKNMSKAIKELGNYSINDALGDIASIITVANGYELLYSNLIDILDILGICTPILSNFVGILSNVIPFLAVGTAIVGVVTVIGSLISSTDEATNKTDKYIEKLNQKREAIHENTAEMKKNSEAMIDNAKSIQNDYSFTLGQVDELVKLTGNGGYATNLEKAKYLVEQINGILPNSVSITEDGRIAWQDNTKAAEENGEVIKASIKDLERRKLAQSFEKDVAEALKNRTKYEAELISAQNAREIAQNNVTEAEKIYQEELDKGGPNLKEYHDNLTEANKKLTEQNGFLYEAQSQFAANEKMINMYSYSYEALDGNIDATAKLHAEMYTKVGNRGTSTWKSLGDALVDLDRQYDEHLKNGYDDSSEEIELNTKTTDLIRQQCFDKAAAYGKSFDEMMNILNEKGVTLTVKESEEWEKQYNSYQENIKNKEELQKLGFENMLTILDENGVALDIKNKEILNQELLNWKGNAKSKEEIQALNIDALLLNLENAGVQLNETQKGLLEKGCEDWKAKAIEKEEAFDASISTINKYLLDGLTNMNSESSSKVIDLINILKDGGIEGGLELCQKLAKSLEDNGGKVTDETMEIIELILALAKNNKPVSEFDVIGKSREEISGIIRTMQGYVGNLNLPVWLQPITKGLEGMGLIFSNRRADGGFVDTGELFVAREAGPELVGRINGKTAVANNDQIVSGISSGVYNAMIGAMSKGNRSNTTVTAIFQVDGKQVAKQVINAHNKEVIQTGRSPLLI
ncbi:hypothetical protein [Thomasclavelia sp.]